MLQSLSSEGDDEDEEANDHHAEDRNHKVHRRLEVVGAWFIR